MQSTKEIYLDIVETGILIIRKAASLGNKRQCFVESDHIHNIPMLLKNLDNQELHRYYWMVTRNSYIQMSKPEYVCKYEYLWKQLGKIKEMSA